MSANSAEAQEIRSGSPLEPRRCCSQPRSTRTCLSSFGDASTDAPNQSIPTDHGHAHMRDFARGVRRSRTEHPRRFESLNLTSFRRRSLSAVRALANQMSGASVGPKRRSDTQIDGAVARTCRSVIRTIEHFSCAKARAFPFFDRQTCGVLLHYGQVGPALSTP